MCAKIEETQKKTILTKERCSESIRRSVLFLGREDIYC